MILYHGNSENLFRPSTAKIGRGYEANSALGFWTTTDIDLAISYAGCNGGDSYVHVFRLKSPELVLSFGYDNAIYGPTGLDTDREIALPLFMELRRQMMEEGVQGVLCDEPDTDIHDACCVFDPDDLEQIGTIRLSDNAWRPGKDIAGGIEFGFGIFALHADLDALRKDGFETDLDLLRVVLIEDNETSRSTPHDEPEKRIAELQKAKKSEAAQKRRDVSRELDDLWSSIPMIQMHEHVENRILGGVGRHRPATFRTTDFRELRIV